MLLVGVAALVLFNGYGRHRGEAPIEPLRIVLALPRFFFHPVTAWVIAVVHFYLSAEHLFGALGGAYAFAALATRTAFARRASTYSSQRDG